MRLPEFTADQSLRPAVGRYAAGATLSAPAGVSPASRTPWCRYQCAEACSGMVGRRAFVCLRDCLAECTDPNDP